MLTAGTTQSALHLETALSSPGDLRTLANQRVREAQVLLRAREWSGAYYLAGYAAECALKACVAREFRKYRMPDHKVMKDIYTHRLEDIVKVANLQTPLALEMNSDPAFNLNWAVAKDWTEASRYAIWTEPEAQDLLRAINERNHGVLQWVKRHW